jgi:hypothetical protein
MSSFSRSSRKAAIRRARRTPLSRFGNFRRLATLAFQAAVEGDDDAWEAYGEAAFYALTGDPNSFAGRMGWPRGYGRASRGEPTLFI